MQRIALIFIACLGVANFAGEIYPDADRKSAYWRISNEALFKALYAGDLLITEGGFFDSCSAYCGGPRVTVVHAGSTPIAEITWKIDRRRSRVLISS